MESEKKLWSYDGIVVIFEEREDRYTGKTWAVSESKARSNIAAQYKRLHGLLMSVPVRLVNNVKLVEE